MKLTYRPEIDGLRAIAVGAVILYHAQISIFGHKPFSGGFIGVDIFFVISGYLITSIILKELIITNSFSFKHFYERRVRRILPALLFVMLVSLPFAWLYLLPSSFVDFSKSILYSLGFSSNFYFHYSGQEYGVGGLRIPFLHTWSLSVEEQFYILFPIVLLVTFKYFRKYLIHILILGFIISLGLAEWTSRNYPSVSFYFLHTRMWELLAGSILAYFEITLGHRSKNKTLNLILPSIGLFLIGYSIIFFNLNSEYLSIYTSVPIIGVCFIIWFSSKDELITKILSTKLFVGIGLISYSLYLWHYPIFAYYNIIFFYDKNYYHLFIILFLIFFLSIISYYYVEKYFRNQQIKFKSYLILIIIFLFLIFINYETIRHSGYEKKFYTFKNNKNYQLDTKLKEKNYEYFFSKNHKFEYYDKRKKALIIGNSHGHDLLKILSQSNLNNIIHFTRFKDNGMQVFEFFYILQDKIDLISNKEVKQRLNKDKIIKKYMKSDLIIISSRYSDLDIQILNKLIERIIIDGKKVVIFDRRLKQKSRTVHGLNELDYFVFVNKKFPNQNELQQIENKMFLIFEESKDINLKIKEISEKTKVFLVKSEEIFCNYFLKSCKSITDEGYKIYYDTEHITKEGVNFFSKKIEKNDLFLNYLNSTLNISSN